MPENIEYSGKTHRLACVALACICIVAAGCGDDSRTRAEASAGRRAAVPRGEDPEYVRALEKSVSDEAALRGELASAEAAYEEARANDPDGEEAKALAARIGECREKIVSHREDARRMVAGRIWREFQEKDAAEGRGARKGEQ